MKILVIGAHPADPFDLAGGTIYSHVNNGHKVEICSVTYGMVSHSISVSKAADKEYEVLSAAEMLGIEKSHFMAIEDEPLIYNTFDVRKLAGWINIIRPNVVITHHPNEYAHFDHAEAGKLVCRALKSVMKIYNYWVPTVYFFAVQFRPEVVRLGYVPQAPDILIDIGPFLDKKAEALRCFKSQGHDKIAWTNRFNSMESEMGRADGMRYTEGFSLYYPLKRKMLEVNTDGGFYSG